MVGTVVEVHPRVGLIRVRVKVRVRVRVKVS